MTEMREERDRKKRGRRERRLSSQLSLPQMFKCISLTGNIGGEREIESERGGGSREKGRER